MCTKIQCEKQHVQLKIDNSSQNIKRTVEEKINKGNIYDVNQRDDVFA